MQKYIIRYLIRGLAIGIVLIGFICFNISTKEESHIKMVQNEQQNSKTGEFVENLDTEYQLVDLIQVEQQFYPEDLEEPTTIPSFNTTYSKSSNTIPHLLMGDDRWGQSLFRYSDAAGGSPMISSGCGPTALAMILNGYGIEVSPIDVANRIADHGGHLKGVGTAGSSLIEAANSYGVKMAKVAYDKDSVVKALQMGHAMIAGHGGEFSTPLFAARGGSGHFVVYTGISDDGKLIYVNDPNDYDNEKHVYDIDVVLAEQPDIYVVL